jgi:hypothetical protein
MPVGRALAGSIAAHVGGLALVVNAFAPSRTHAVASRAISRARVAPAAEPIAVVIFDERATASGLRGAAVVSNERASGHARGAATAAETAAGDGAVGRSRGADLMTMRGPELHLDDAALAAIAGHTELPSPVRISGRLHDRPGGTGVIHDAVATVTVERDGTAHLESMPDIDIHLKLPVLPDIRQDLRDIGQDVAEWYADPYAGERYNRTIDLPQHLQAIPGQCDTYGDAMCDDAMSPEMKATKNPLSNDGGATSIAGGRLDLTSYLAKKFHVGDVYASRKLKLLDDTRDERVARGTEFRADQLAHSAELMQRNLDRLAAIDPAELHEALFELWDECAEDDAGDRARAQVIGWIGAHLPAGHAGEFTADEIATLDARRASTQHFAPYPR